VNESAWAELSVFESSDLIKRFYKRRHNLDLSAGKALEITTALTQARQYFLELRSAGDLARPLLLYYGVVALSRALILFLQPAAKEENLSQSHGLTVHMWQQTLASGIRHVPDLQVKVTEGTFSELANATKGTDRTKVRRTTYPSTVVLVREGALETGWAFAFKDLLARIPDLHNLYEETFDEFASCRLVEVLLVTDARYEALTTVPRTRRGLPPEDQVRRDLQLTAEERLNHVQGPDFESWSVQQVRQSEQEIPPSPRRRGVLERALRCRAVCWRPLLWLSCWLSGRRDLAGMDENRTHPGRLNSAPQTVLKTAFLSSASVHECPRKMKTD
jgi:hypothetical protein